MERLRDEMPGTVVLAVGCFDLLHAGHIRHLKNARELGDHLIVSLTSDEYVLKGPGRPVITEDDRAMMVDALKCVDFVFVNSLPPPGLEQFDAVRPDIYVKGKEYRGNINPFLAEQIERVEVHGGKIVFTDTEELHTTALIVEAMRELQS
jgi:rfaE bifunctional protein nucleotidyltransferase chain/domain